MTSSLVGSEMCIRDRSFGYGKKDKNWEEADNVRERLWADLLNDGEDTVSYTHLTLPTICSV
eukprot:4861390-Prorocentrum_lima.AAC.1